MPTAVTANVALLGDPRRFGNALGTGGTDLSLFERTLPAAGICSRSDPSPEEDGCFGPMGHIDRLLPSACTGAGMVLCGAAHSCSCCISPSAAGFNTVFKSHPHGPARSPFAFLLGTPRVARADGF